MMFYEKNATSVYNIIARAVYAVHIVRTLSLIHIFPIMEDLHSMIETKAEANPDNPVFRDLAMLLYDAAKGSDSFLWNGHSTLEADSHFVCLDTHSLQNAADNIKRTQYFNLLTWCWEQMSNNRGERVLLVCDEAYLMIDPQVPQSLAFLRNVEKLSLIHIFG